MKNILLSTTLLFALAFASGCAGKKDSNAAAKDINETKIKNEVTANAQDATKGEQQEESNYLVDLANTGLTEYELSKVAVDRATNPAVKAYAKDLVIQHAADEKDLRAMAQQKNLTLPTTLSRGSQDKLADLVDEKTGKDFDKKYIQQLQTINDKAIGDAKGIRDNTESNAMKAFINKILADDQTHKEKADKLEKQL